MVQPGESVRFDCCVDTNTCYALCNLGNQRGPNLCTLSSANLDGFSWQTKFTTNHGDKWQATVTGEAKTVHEWTIDGRDGGFCVGFFCHPLQRTLKTALLDQLAPLYPRALVTDDLFGSRCTRCLVQTMEVRHPAYEQLDPRQLAGAAGGAGAGRPTPLVQAGISSDDDSSSGDAMDRVD